MMNKLRNALLNYRKRFNNEIEYSQLENIISKNDKFFLIDVRSRQEFKESHLKNAINISLYNIENEIENIIKDKNEMIIVYCQNGGRSKKAVKKLQQKGYINIYNLKGGLDYI